MMIGNPYNFAIDIALIDEWNDSDTFKNGVLLICIDGFYFPNEVLNATLSCEIPMLKESLQHITIDIKLYNLPKVKAFTELYNITYPSWDSEKDIDYRFCITPNTMSDKNYIIFAVSNGKQVRILASKLKYIMAESTHDLDNINISETYIDCSELNKLASQIKIPKSSDSFQ